MDVPETFVADAPAVPASFEPDSAPASFVADERPTQTASAPLEVLDKSASQMPDMQATTRGGSPLSLPTSGEVVASLSDVPQEFWETINTPTVNLVEPFTEGEKKQLRNESKGVQAAMGVGESLGNTVNFFTSPMGVATLGVGALPRAAQRVIAAGFAALMAYNTKEVATELGAELGKPEEERDPFKVAELITTGATSLGFATLAGKHSLTSNRQVVINELAKILKGEPNVQDTGVTPIVRELQAANAPATAAVIEEIAKSEPLNPGGSRESLPPDLKLIEAENVAKQRQIAESFKAELAAKESPSSPEVTPKMAAVENAPAAANLPSSVEKPSEPGTATGAEQTPTVGKPVPSSPEQPGLQPEEIVSMGAATAGAPMPKTNIESLTDAFKGIESEKPPLRERVKRAFNLGAQAEQSKDLLARTLNGINTAGQYVAHVWKGVDKIDDVLRVKGELSAELETRGWRLRQAAKEFKRAIPDVKVREAISKYVDAGGDSKVLADSMARVPADKQAPYERALHLTADEHMAAQHITAFFESRLQEAIDAGVLEDGVADYIHRTYKRESAWKADKLKQIQSGILNTRKPGLAMRRIFELDADAEAAGYNVESDFIPRIIEYEASLSKVIASRAAVKKFMEIKMPDGRPMIDVAGMGTPIKDAKGVKEATLIRPSFKPGDETDPLNNRKDYQPREYPALRKWKWVSADAKGEPIMVQGDVLIHPDAARRVDALLKPSWVTTSTSPVAGAMRGVKAVGSTFKQTMLDFSGFHQVQIALHGLEHKVNPFRLVKEIDFDNPEIKGLLKGGVTLGGEHVSGVYKEGLVGRSLSRHIPGLGPLMESYHSWLFQDFIPRMKMTMALHALERNRSRFEKDLKSGKMSEEALYFQTAKEANAAFGELNYVMLERSKTAQDIARTVLLAPDFLEARGRFAAQAGTKLGGEQRMALFLGAITMYTVARIVNKILDDQYHFEPENAFSVVHNGHAYGLRTVQGDILHLMDEPVKFWLNRLNPVTTKPLLQIAAGRDVFGRKRSFIETMGDTISNIVPISMRNNRERKLWESLLNAFGVTERRYNDITKAHEIAENWKKSNNIKTAPGEFIYNPDLDVYRPVKLALLDNDEGGAAVELKKLLDSGKATRSEIHDYFKQYSKSPFTGSLKNDRKMIESLSEDERKTVEAAKQERKRMYETYSKAVMLLDSPQPNP